MKKLVIWIGGGLLLAAGGAGFYMANLPARAAEGTTLGEMNLSGLTEPQVRSQLESWWQAEKSQVVEIESHLLRNQPEPMTLEELGIRPDWDATLTAIEFETAFSKLIVWRGNSKYDRYNQSNQASKPEVKVAWRIEPSGQEELVEFIEANARNRQPARVLFEGGKIVRKYEVNTFRLDLDRLGDVALAAIAGGNRKLELPVVMEDPKISKADLDAITDVVSEFTTSFNQGQSNRTSNIRLATEKLNGVVLMPGEVLSYNETVGKRISSEGFKLAGIYANGRRDQGIGGGICQVSSTLFNAALLANLEIAHRQNHSMPVPYVAVGRDATVAYGAIDLKIRNNTDRPVAIAGEAVGNKVTFRVLGKEDPTLEVAIVTTDHSSWGNQVKYVTDGSLAPGATKVVESGSTGRKCVTWRVLRRDGREIGRERIATSTYQAFPRIVARGPDKPAEAATATLDPPSIPPDSGDG